MNKKYSVFDNLIEGVQVIDRDYKYYYVNDSVSKQAKTTPKDLIGHTMMEKYPGFENSQAFGLIKECMNNRVSNKLINEFVFPDRSKGWFELSIQPVDEGVIVLSYDITEQKRNEVELEIKVKEKEELIEVINSQKKKLEDFCQIIAHDLRGPILNLELLSNLIKETSNLDEKLEFLSKQEPVISYLQNILEELVETTQIYNTSNSNFIDIDLLLKCERIIESMQGEIDKVGAKFEFDFSEVRFVKYNEVYLNSILYNLINNAVKYSAPQNVLIHIRSYIKNGWIYLEVEDNGIGIDLKQHGDRMFKYRKVFSDNPSSKGIGLYMTKARIEANGGKIWVYSKPNVGTRFVIQLKKKGV